MAFGPSCSPNATFHLILYKNFLAFIARELYLYADADFTNNCI